MRYIFFPQNETHFQNLLPIYFKIKEKGIEGFFINTESIYRQTIFLRNQNIIIKEIPIRLTKSFYLENITTKIITTIKFRKVIKKIIRKDDKVIICNDGSLQRTIISIVGLKNTYLILDSIISNYQLEFMDILRFSNRKFFDMIDFFRRRIKIKLHKLYNLLPFSYLLPSEIGHTKVYKLFVSGKYVVDVLKELKSPNKQIFDYGIPRFNYLFSKLENIVNERKNEKGRFNVLIITQGYLWHNEFENDKHQHLEISNILTAREESINKDNIKLTIRVHPRDIISNYQLYLQHKNVSLSNEPIHIDLLQADLVVGFNSTVLIEALFYNIPILIAMTNGQYWRLKNSFIKFSTFLKIYDIMQLKYIFDSPKIVSPDSNFRYYFLSKTTPQSARLIADEIMR